MKKVVPLFAIAMLSALGAFAAPEVQIQRHPERQNCAVVNLVDNEKGTVAHSDYCFNRRRHNAQASLFTDKMGRQYVLLTYRIPDHRQTDQNIEAGSYLLVLRQDKDRLIQISKIRLLRQGWSVASEKTDGLELTVPKTKAAFAETDTDSIWITPSPEPPKDSVKHIAAPPSSLYDVQLIQLGGHYGSVEKGEGWCGFYYRRDSVALRAVKDGNLVAEHKICPGYGYTAARARAVVDSAGRNYVVLDWRTRGTGPHDYLTIYRLEAGALTPALEVQLSAEHIYGTGYTSTYKIERNPERGLKITIQGLECPIEDCPYDNPPIEKFRTIWIDAER